MIDLQDVSPLALPSVALSDRALLPHIRAVYFVISNDEVVYIGKAACLVTRWKAHHRLSQLGMLEDVRIAWLACQEMMNDELLQAEQTCILYFKPRLNRYGTHFPLHLRVKAQKEQRAKRYRHNTRPWIVEGKVIAAQTGR